MPSQLTVLRQFLNPRLAAQVNTALLATTEPCGECPMSDLSPDHLGIVIVAPEGTPQDRIDLLEASLRRAGVSVI